MATVVVSMATRSSDLDNQKPGIDIQTEGHIVTPTSSQNGPENPEAFSSAPLHSLSWSLARKPTPDQPGTQYCLEIQVTSTKDEGVTPPAPHAWLAPIMEDIVWIGKSSLTEAVVTGPGRSILFYRWQSLGGLNVGEVWDAMFTLSGAIGMVGKQAQLSSKIVSLVDVWQLITQVITKGHIEARGLVHPDSIPPLSTSFSFW